MPHSIIHGQSDLSPCQALTSPGVDDMGSKEINASFHESCMDDKVQSMPGLNVTSGLWYLYPCIMHNK
eukprot:1159348-Pelagomonas_calceolata.AAC.5